MIVKKMTALRILADLDYQAKRDLYRNVPEHGVPKTKFDDKTANGLTRCITAFLRLKGCYVTRVNTTGRFIQGSSYIDVLGHRKQFPGKWIPGSTSKGTADLHCVIAGKHVSVEVKVGRDRMSEAQTETKHAVEASGGFYWIVRSFDEFYENWLSIQLLIH